MEATASSTNGASQPNLREDFEAFLKNAKSPDAKLNDVLEQFKVLLKRTSEIAKNPGRQTEDLTPERLTRIKKIDTELRNVILNNSLEHGPDRVLDAVIATAVDTFLIDLGKLTPGILQTVIASVAPHAGFDVRIEH